MEFLQFIVIVFLGILGFITIRHKPINLDINEDLLQVNSFINKEFILLLHKKISSDRDNIDAKKI